MLHVNSVSYHQGIVSPQVADGGDGFQIWRVAANRLKKQSPISNKRWSSTLWAGMQPKEPSKTYGKNCKLCLVHQCSEVASSYKSENMWVPLD
jgi:hypothetical protein